MMADINSESAVNAGQDKTPQKLRDCLPATLPEKAILLGWLRQMLLIREFEVRTMQAYQNRLIGGFCHIYIGQEAVAVGTIAAINPDDPIVAAYRDHGYALARGMDPKHCMAEMFGRIGGCAKGKGGSMHMFDAEHHLYGGHGIVGGQTPLGAGLAFATKYEDEVLTEGESSHVTLCYLGDGALNQGAFYESMNLAGLYDLPVIFVLENNGYSMGTSIERGTTMANELRTKSEAHGIDHIVVDGKNVLSLYQDFKPIVDWCRENSRPYFVEAKTYRYKGHSMSDPRKYRTKDEERQEEANDCIEHLTQYLCDEHDLATEAIKQMSRQVKAQVKLAVQWANQSPEPPIEELYTDVYTDHWGPYTGTSKPEMLRPEDKS
ncbi:MAG: pyruvate dehydrogenase (acetyl-transferring) E1 component subunit alpha [Planctomycetota bacterium]|nr:pyruvate dehydrogenase (acetyl-transferring) E1 component subunit alpha [Planctomycetota bacterium]